MAPQLVDLANEIIESIVVLLDLSDICSLRLTGRLLASKVTQDHFKTFFRSKKVDLTKPSLERFIDATRPGLLGSLLLENLTLVGVVNNPKRLESILRKGRRTVTSRNGPIFSSTEEKCSPEEMAKARADLNTINRRRGEHEQLRQSGQDVMLLTEALTNIAVNGKAGGLHALSLEVVVYREDAELRQPPKSGGGWKYIFQAAADTYKTAMPALARSGLAVHTLNMFNSEGQTRCSIPSNELSALNLDEENLQTCLSAIKSLSISLSDRIINETDRDAGMTGDPGDNIDWTVRQQPRDINDLRAEAADEQNFLGLAKLVSLCSNLEELDLHYFNLSIHVLTPVDAKDEIVLQRLAQFITKGHLTNLQKCRLRGFHVWEQDLLSLLQHFPALQDLTLENMMLTASDENNNGGGSFQSIFSHCTAETLIQKLFFDDLFEKGRLVYFDDVPGGGEPKFPSICGTRGSNTLVRTAGNVCQPIKYHFAQGRPFGSPQAYFWREGRRMEYGPP